MARGLERKPCSVGGRGLVVGMVGLLAGAGGVWGQTSASGGGAGGGGAADPVAFVARDSLWILGAFRTLAHDSMEGRRVGTPGGARARAFLVETFRAIGLQEPPAGYVQDFSGRGRRDTTQVIQGANVVGYLAGSQPELGAIVLTAHYDHLGIRPPRPDAPPEAQGDSIYNGADDNASGVTGLLAAARYFAAHPPRHTLVFAALDAEEAGMHGARDFVARGWPERIVLNVNLDMISRSDSVLWVAGTYHYPHLRPLLDGVRGVGRVVLRFGHDEPGVQGMDDWTRSSDHAAFHARGIPFLYLGVEDHPDYHRATDEFERVDPAFFLDAVRTVLTVVAALDRRLEGS